eukprot:s4236_g4.t4
MTRHWAAAVKRSEWQQKWDRSLWALQALALQDELTQADCTAGVKACGKALRWEWALQLLSWSRKFSIRHPWNPAISACALVTEWERALLLLRSMRHRGPKPSVSSYSAALDALARAAEWARGLHLLSEMKRRVAPDLVAVTSVIVACGAAARWTVALQLFERASVEFHGGDVVLLGASAAACGRGHQWQASLTLLKCGSAARLLNATLFGACLAACANSSVWVQAAALLQGMSRAAIAPGEAGLTAAASAFSSAELWQQALDVLSRAEPQTGAWWGAAIAAATRGFRWEQALELYARMPERSVSPNEACSSAVQTACVRASRWEVSLVLLSFGAGGEGLARAQAQIPLGCLGPVLAACQHGALWIEALHYLRQAQLAGMSGVVMRASAMAACAEASKWSWALRLLPALTSGDAEPNAVCFGVALHACRLGRQWAASLWMLWDEMPRCSVRPDWVAFCAALLASERSHKGVEVLHLVQQLRRGAVGHEPRLQSSRLGERLAAASLLDQHSRLSSSCSRQIWRLCDTTLKLPGWTSADPDHAADLEPAGDQLCQKSEKNAEDGDYFNDVYKYDIATSMWGSVHTLGEAPTKRTDHSVVLFRDSLLVFGGFDGHNRFNDLRELHLKDKRWSQISVRSQQPRNRFGHTAVIYAHSMYIFGGWDGHDTLQELFEYNISSNMWIQLPLRGTAPRARYRHTAVVCGDAMFTFGGVDKTQYRFPDLHEYNFTHRHWLKVATMSVQPSARTFHKTVVHEGYMYILGGFDGRRLNDMYRILLRTKSELQRCQKQLAEQAASSPPVPSSSARPEDAPGSTGAVGDAQDAAQTLMPEDLWCWTRIDDQLGQVYTPRTGHAVVVWNHCFYLMGVFFSSRIASQLWRHRSVPERAFSSIPPGLLRLGLAPSLLDEAHSVAFEAGPSQALAHLTRRQALEPDPMQQQVAKQLDALCLTHCVPGPGAARARCHVSLRSAEKMDELRKAFCKACPVSAVAAVAWSDPVVEVGPNHGPSLPEGLRYIRDFVTCSEEAELVAAMDEGEWLTHLIRAQQFFGLVYYQTRHDMASLQPASTEMQQGRAITDLPWWLLPRLVDTGVFRTGELNQVAANKYTGTTGIAAHVEDPISFGPNLATLSLLQPVQMTLSLASEVKNSKESPGDGVDHGNWLKVLLEPRSLLILQGQSRYAYRHGIRRSRLVRLRDGTEMKRGSDYCRISLTFRQLLETRRMVHVWSSTWAYSEAYDLWKQSRMEWEAECARRVAAHEQQRRQLEQDQSHDRKDEKSDFPQASVVLPAEPTKPSLRSRGCYIWGQVGRGKTLLMDVFALSFQPTKNSAGMGTLPSKAHLRRVHFHEFIHELHRQLHRSGGQSGLAAAVDVVMSGQPPVLCFDEFQITTIADASTAARLLTPLFSDLLTRDIAVVITSNRSPNELYKGGIGANERLESAFRVACEGQAVGPMLLQIAWGRSMLCQHVANGVAKFTFEELCGNPLSSEDYLALIRSAGIHTFVVSDVPQFGLNLHNEARRFTNFVDALYEQQCRIDGLCSAEVESDQPAMGIGGSENSLRWHRHGDISFHSSDLSPCRPDTFATAEADAEAGCAPDIMLTGSSSTFLSSKVTWRGISPLQQLVDLKRFGAALLITSECDGAAWQAGGPFEDGPKLLLPGGKYINRSRSRYREQSKIAVELVTTALLEAGVPEECIEHLDCCDDLDASFDPVALIPQFWRRHLNPVTRVRDALIYYFGFSIEGGAWALTWTNVNQESKVCILEPDSVLPPVGVEDGVPGARLVVSDAPGSARMWLRPARRLRGVAAWEGDAMPGSSGGPPLARWLAGYMPEAPKGVEAFLQPCPEAGLEDLPCHKLLFWGPSPPESVELASHLLWELTEFVGAETMRSHRPAAIEEILVKGGPEMLLKTLSIVTSREQGQERLALQALWLLQALAAESPAQRWAGTMNEAFQEVMKLTERLLGGFSNPDHPHLLAAILSFFASCASRCANCRDECSAGTKNWASLLQLINSAFESLQGEAEAAAAEAAAEAACHVVSQVASHRALRALGAEHQLFVRLLEMFSSPGASGAARAARAGEPVMEAAAEALLYITFRCNDLKLEILKIIRQFQLEQALCDTLLHSSRIGLKQKLLAFLRSIASVQPPSVVLDAFPSGCIEGGIIDVIISTLRRHEDPSMQRWGLAALGAICNVDERFAARGVQGGAATAVLWALGADQATSLEQDALFCAFALLQSDSGSGGSGGGQDLTDLLSPEKLGRLPALTASAVARGLREEGGSSEAALWGLRIFERICQKHALVVEPFVDAILEAMLATSCLHGTMVAGSNAVSHLASVCPGARAKLMRSYVDLIKALQSMGHIAACEGTEDGRQRERELMDWVQVLVDILGPPRPVKSDDQVLCEQLQKEEEEEAASKLTSKPGSKAGTKSNQGTKSNAGTKLETASLSRTGTKLGTKEESGKTRSKSKLQ